jgi:hypothetical protein
MFRNLVHQAFLLNYFSVAQTNTGGVLKFVGAFFAMRNRDFLRRGSKPGRTTFYPFIGVPRRSPPDWCGGS